MLHHYLEENPQERLLKEIEFYHEQIRDQNGRLHDQLGRFTEEIQTEENLPEYPTLMERLEQLKLVSEYMKKENEHTFIKKYKPTLLAWSILGFFTYCLLIG